MQNRAGYKSILEVGQQAKREPEKLTMSDEERAIYGNRCPKGYIKEQLLGRGGCALVYLGRRD